MFVPLDVHAKPQVELNALNASIYAHHITFMIVVLLAWFPVPAGWKLQKLKPNMFPSLKWDWGELITNIFKKVKISTVVNGSYIVCRLMNVGGWAVLT